MPVQDLTPQLRTRLSHVERAVGWFVIVATLLLLAGFGYYVYHTAERKGWFKIKVRYNTMVNSGAGLHVGDPVKLMGFDVGQITEINAMPPYSSDGNVYLEFIVQEPFYGYIWDDSKAKVTTADFLGKRTIEVLRGGSSGSTNKLYPTYRVDSKNHITGIWDPNKKDFVAYTKSSKGYTLQADESPALSDRLETVANEVQKALPNFLALTNQIAALLTNTTRTLVHADDVVLQARPLLTNLAVITAALTNGNGALGDWLIPTNLNAQLQVTLTNANTTLLTANSTLASTHTNLNTLSTSLNMTLLNLANITSNLNAQVQTNDQILSRISTTIVNADDFIQGLKHHWLLRSAFKHENEKRPEATPERRREPAEPKQGKR